MRPFRVVKQRKGSLETDQDLRGLSDEAFFKHAHPLSVLTVYVSPQHSALITQALENNYPSLEWFTESNALHITGRKEHNEKFKQDLIDLYVLSLTLAENIPGSVSFSMNLWVLDQLRVHMKMSAEGKPSIDTHKAIESHHPKSTHFLSITQRCLPYLRQAGFCEVLNANSDWNLSQTEAVTLLSKERLALEGMEESSHSRKVI